MGVLTEFLETVSLKAAPATQAIAAAIPGWQAQMGQTQAYTYERYAREGYGKNELVFACIEELATSAAEPRLMAYRGYGKSKEALDTVPALQLFEHPSPFMDRYTFMAMIVMYRAIAGNVFIEKVRSRAGKVVELWFLRPDRVRIIPDPKTFIAGYEYRHGDLTFTLPPEDVIHLKTRNPYDDFYGMPPLAACAERVDTDNAMRAFTHAFFRNAAVPAGLLNIMKPVQQQEREMIRQHVRQQYSGSTGWHSTMVIDGGEVKYEPMGMAIGERGIAMPSLDEIDEARIAMCFGVPLSLAGARLGQASSSYANRRADREMFWDETLIPLYRQIAAGLTLGLRDDFPGQFEYLDFDLSDVQALQEDETAKVDRVSKKLDSSMITVEEGRQELGYEPEFSPGQTLVMTAGRMLVPVESATAPPLDAPPEGDPNSPDYPEARGQ